MTQRTLIVIKPDAVRRGLIGKIITRFEEKGFKILDLKMLTFTRQQAEKFYEPHLGKPFFQDLVNFITSGPVVAAILEAPNAVSVVRLMIGSTRSFEASPGTIRGDFGLGITENVIHASDSEESFKRESAIVFS
ncbi:MAG: nucleoside-diphosphate kinase [Nitrososphaerales archaeon]